MNRQQKEAVIVNFNEEFKTSSAAFLVNYKGISVADMQSLRHGLRDDSARLKVTKARLMKLAVHDIEGVGEFKNNFKNQVGLIFAHKEVPVVAKRLVDFAKEHDSFDIVAGFFEKNVVTHDQVKALASLPSREVLLGMVACVLQSPIRGFAHILRMMLIRLLYTLQQVADKRNAGN